MSENDEKKNITYNWEIQSEKFYGSYILQLWHEKMQPSSASTFCGFGFGCHVYTEHGI